MSENAEVEDLEQLMACPGWARFVDMTEKQWGRNSETFHDAVENAAKGDNVHLSDHLRQILTAQREIMKLLDLPAQRLKLLKGASARPELVVSRRGGL